MIKNVYVTKDGTATFVCDACDHARIEDVSRYLNIGKRLTVKCKCRCGHQFNVHVEKRRYVRRATNCVGSYTYIDDNGNITEGAMRVKDVSRGGFRLEFAARPPFAVGDRLDIEFNLDDPQRSRIAQRVVVRNLGNGAAGVEMMSFDYSKALWRYLIN